MSYLKSYFTLALLQLLIRSFSKQLCSGCVGFITKGPISKCLQCVLTTYYYINLNSDKQYLLVPHTKNEQETAEKCLGWTPVWKQFLTMVVFNLPEQCSKRDHHCLTNEELVIHAKPGRTAQPHTLCIWLTELAFISAVLRGEEHPSQRVPQLLCCLLGAHMLAVSTGHKAMGEATALHVTHSVTCLCVTYWNLWKKNFLY